jgi:phosphoglycerol transferase MdoB-like AlkP superfamily enzyme
MSSIFSSFPVFPYVAVINQSDKSRKLPCLNKTLAEKGYHSSFFFGGQLTYGNIKGYLLSQGFNVVKDENDYQDLPSGALGVHDEFMFSQFKEELKLLPEPFMSALFTISSHSPFDFPAEHKLSFDHKDDKYVNSVAYTDVCLGNFMESVKQEDWYANTLFVIVADHSHSSPIKRRVAQKERYKIPMLWIGEVLSEQYKGKQHNKMGSHLDITPSILAQLNLANKAYHFGNDLFNPTAKSVVPYAFHKGYGLIRPEANYAFSESYNKVIEIRAADSLQKATIKKETELYFQAAFKEYMEL